MRHQDIYTLATINGDLVKSSNLAENFSRRECVRLEPRAEDKEEKLSSRYSEVISYNCRYFLFLETRSKGNFWGKFWQLP